MDFTFAKVQEWVKQWVAGWVTNRFVQKAFYYADAIREEFYLADAVRLTTNQTVAGVKTFSNDVVINSDLTIQDYIKMSANTGTLLLTAGTSNTEGPNIEMVGKDAGGSTDGTIKIISSTESGAQGKIQFMRYNGTSWLVMGEFDPATNNLTIADSARFVGYGVRAKDSNGLKLEDDAGNLGIHLQDGGDVAIGNVGSFGSRLSVLETDPDVASFEVDGSYARIHIASYRTSALTHAELKIKSSRGSKATPSAIQAGDLLFNIRVEGYGTSAWPGGNTGEIAFEADGTHTNTSQPGRIAFRTAPSGSITALDAMLIDSDQYVGIGNTDPAYATPSYSFSGSTVKLLRIGGNQYGRLTVQGSVDAALSLIDTGASSGNKWFYAVTNGGATKFMSLSDAAGTQTDNIIYMQHSNGNIGIGKTSTTYKLDVNGDIAATGINLGEDTLTVYDEGTWTPVIRFGGGGTGQSYTLQNGYYTRTGNQVIAQFEIQLSAKGSSTGIATIGGLPVAASSAIGSYVNVGWVNMATSLVNMSIGGSGSTSMTIYGIAAAATSSFTARTHADFNNNTQLYGTLIYRV